MNCLFCKIITGEIPCKRVYEDDRVLAFYDINPQAKIHILVVPKQHICCANAITSDNSDVVSAVFEAIPKIANTLGIENYRVINNCGEKAGQSVMHLHFHLLNDDKLGAKIV